MFHMEHYRVLWLALCVLMLSGCMASMATTPAQKLAEGYAAVANARNQAAERLDQAVARYQAAPGETAKTAARAQLDRARRVQKITLEAMNVLGLADQALSAGSGDEAMGYLRVIDQMLAAVEAQL